MTASVWTNQLATAHKAAASIEAGYIWANQTSTHFLRALFGGFKQSGLGREERIEKMFVCTELKNVSVK